MNTKLKGDCGEEIAMNYLKSQNYKIIDRNYHSIFGEIDIIAMDKSVIVFVEVKYRKTTEFGMPRESVTIYKQNKIRKTALIYLKQKNLFDSEIRFDVIEILDKEITQIKSAF